MAQSIMNVLIVLFAVSVVSAVVGQIADEPETTTEQFEATTEVYISDTEMTDDINASLADRACRTLVRQQCTELTCSRQTCSVCFPSSASDSETSTDVLVQNETISSIDVDGVTLYADGNDDVTLDATCVKLQPGVHQVCCGARTCSLCIG